MKYEKKEGQTHIFIEGEETEQQVLRAIVKASFELARPAGMGWVHFNKSQKMTDEAADQCINMSPSYGSNVVSMDYVQGRQCKTFIQRNADGHFVLNDRSFECDRGTVDPMLDKAKEILAGKEQDGLADTSHMYAGESLTLRMQEYGLARLQNESDWNFRKRVFPDLYQKDPDRAMEFLMGASAAEWNEMDTLLYLALASKGRPNHNDLVKFAKGFGWDPSQTRGKRTAPAIA